MQYVIRDHSSPLSREIVIEDRHRQRLFRAHGPVVRVRDELHLEDAKGVEQAYIKDPVLGDSSTFEILSLWRPRRRRQGSRRRQPPRRL